MLNRPPFRPRTVSSARRTQIQARLYPFVSFLSFIRFKIALCALRASITLPSAVRRAVLNVLGDLYCFCILCDMRVTPASFCTSCCIHVALSIHFIFNSREVCHLPCFICISIRARCATSRVSFAFSFARGVPPRVFHVICIVFQIL